MNGSWHKYPVGWYNHPKVARLNPNDAAFFMACLDVAKSGRGDGVVHASSLLALPLRNRSKIEALIRLVQAGLLEIIVDDSVSAENYTKDGAVSVVDCTKDAGLVQSSCSVSAVLVQKNYIKTALTKILDWSYWGCIGSSVSAGRGPVKQRQLPEVDHESRARARREKREERENNQPTPPGSGRLVVPASAAPRDARGAAPRLPNDGEVVPSDVVSAPAGPEQQDPDPDDGPPMTKEEAREEMRRLIQKSRFHRKDRNDIVPKGWSAKERAEAASGVTGEGKPEPEHIGYLTTGIIPPSQNGHSTWQADKGDPDGEPA